MPDSSSFLQDAEKREAMDKSFEKTGWSTLETTAENMNAVLKNAGVSGVSVKQLFNHPGKIHSEASIHAIMLFYKWRPDNASRPGWNPSKMPSMFAEGPERNGREDNSSFPGDRIMHFNQTVSNASSTQALIVTVLNIPMKAGIDFKLGSDLLELKDFVKPLDPILRTSVICGSEVVLQAHNKTAKEMSQFLDPPSDLDSKASETMMADEFWLYTIFLPDSQSNSVFEMEGMGAGVKVVGVMDETDESWTSIIEEYLDERIGELRVRDAPFRIYGLFDDTHERSLGSSDQNEEKTPNGDMSHGNGLSSPRDSHITKRRKMKSEDEDPNDFKSNKRRNLNSGNEDATFRSCDLSESDIAMHAHNYRPFLVEMMKLMASRGDVQQVLRDAVMAEEKDTNGSEQQKSEIDEDDTGEYTVEIVDEEGVAEGALEDGEVQEGEDSSEHEDDDRRGNDVAMPSATPDDAVYSDQSGDGVQDDDVNPQRRGFHRRERSVDRDVENESRSEGSGGTSSDDG